MSTPQKLLLNKKEAAEMMGIGVRTLERFLRRLDPITQKPVLRSIRTNNRTGGRVLIPVKEIERCISYLIGESA